MGDWVKLSWKSPVFELRLPERQPSLWRRRG